MTATTCEARDKENREATRNHAETYTSGRAQRADNFTPVACDHAPVRTALVALAASGCVTSLHVSTPATVADAVIAPGFSLPAQDGTTVALADGLAKGPVVLVFYRGYW